MTGDFRGHPREFGPSRSVGSATGSLSCVFREVFGGDETRAGELAEITASIRYARGE